MPEAYFFDGAPGKRGPGGKAPSPDFATNFTATPEGLALAKAFMTIRSKKLRRTIAALAQDLAGEE